MSDAQSILGGEIAWRPTPAYIEGSRVTAFMKAHGIASYEALLARSVAEPEWFWAAVLDEIGVEFDEPYQRILDLSRGPAWPRWCVGGRMNIVKSCLDKWQSTATADRPALRWEGEEGTTRILTYRELHALTNQCANGLRSLGLAPGDRVALFMPMCPELVAAFFAVVKAGGVVLPLFSGYGVDAVSCAPPGLGCAVSGHRRWLLAARPTGRDAANGRCRGGSHWQSSASWSCHGWVTRRRWDHVTSPGPISSPRRATSARLSALRPTPP